MKIEHPEYIVRPMYLNRIKPHMGSSLIKVLTGQRRVGKSYLLFQVIDEIQKEYPKATIVSINIPKDRFDHPLSNNKELYKYIVSQFKDTDTHKVVLLDEVQEIAGFEQVLSALYEQGGYDIYVTGSNSHLLSGDLATLLSGRYTELEIHGLSYLEFLSFHNLEDSEESLGKYLRLGGLPYLSHISLQDHELVQDYFNTVEETILLNDVLNAHKGSSKELFRFLVRFLADNIGNPVSANSISKYMKSQHMSITVPTIISFLETLDRAYLVHQTPFYDLEGKQFLDISAKYYYEDLGLRNHLCGGFKVSDRAKVTENVVYLSLLQNGYTITTGRGPKGKEIDFIASKGEKKMYFQVCERFETKEKMETEFGNLLMPRDGYPRFMITADTSMDGMVQDGIKVFSLRHWLKEVQ
ncbi:putative ATPase (AAA+ superfamily) [Sphaerochaeta pleomorpha str. Grapes]|uniref:Putative ATPase (AAA+ superfamily) n=1 Tax=Sphaerochaeta pleomorpha (strain ATCC BAA-1885 / DSM 22778 / Grapes) TaxID=158190 RepID=G8QYX8_SPHPG|nr:ATP-binding protein [Sphaerochaeta pleomorpha]AEV30837.1 putative ATPase (AAA+ superfamily) [Sphaerochaeta pleomorpha str. Grapes]